MATTPNHPENSAGLDAAAPVAPLCSGSDASHNEKAALASLGAHLLKRATESQPAMEAAWEELMASWGIAGEPIDLQQLRALIQQESRANLVDNAFTRELIALRADRRP